MASSERIGRMAVLKQVFILFVLALLVPILSTLYDALFTGFSVNLEALKRNFGVNSWDIQFLGSWLLGLVVIGLGVWFFGARAGRQILKRGKRPYAMGFLNLLKIWTLQLAVLTALQFILHGPPLGWGYIGILINFGVLLVHSLIAGYFVGREIKRHL